MTVNTIRHEGITGASLGGTDGATNRTYTLAYSDAISQGLQINVQGSALQQVNDYTFSAGVITFLNAVFDSMTITLDYFTSDTVTTIASGYGYCTTGDVYRTSGITSTEVSAADVTAQILEAEMFVCRYTKNVYYKTNLDNQAVSSAGASTLVVTGAGWTVSTYVGQYVYIISGIGVGQYRKITANTADTITVDRAWTTNPTSASTFRIFYAPSDINPYIDATGSDSGVEPYDGNDLKYFYLPYYPVNSLEYIMVDATTVTVSNMYLWKSTGKLQFKNGAEASKFLKTYPQLVKVKYWYGVTSLPQDVKRVVELRAAIQILGQQMGGTFDDPSLVTLPEATISIGQAYINIRSSLETLKEEYIELLKTIKVYPAFSY